MTGALPSLVLALDVGASSMAAALIGPDHRVVEYAVTQTPQGADSVTLFDTATFVLNAVLSGNHGPVSALGIACPGPMSWPSGDVSPLNIPGWRDFPLRDRLAEQFGLPTRIHNDAVCLTIGEHVVGVGAGHGYVMGVMVGTGVGGGLIVAGALVDGASGNAGHIGHVVVDPTGPRCECGGRGCLEAVASGPALVEWALRCGWAPTGLADIDSLTRDARSGDRLAVEAFRRGGQALGTALSGVAAVVDLEVIALGGPLTQSADLILPAIYESFRQHGGLEFVQRCRIVLAATDATLVGAAALFVDNYWSGEGADSQRRIDLPEQGGLSARGPVS